ncbi:MAG: hypothetical protein D6714_17925 [Bacteroidetes bacterium]|nr:MAG: hypothetical protein D6714_17925 [Bacteroidota bacterium]
MKKTWFNIALLNLFIAGTMGATLRFAFVREIPWLNFMNFLHGHSHIAMLGWAYLGLYALFIHYFLPDEKKQSPFYERLFWATEVSVLGMLVAFPIQGYGAASITFSTLHILLSYAFARRFLKDLPDADALSRQFVRAALWFMVLSTVSLWAMGPIMKAGLKGSALYFNAVQFFLHFQLNGWFVFGVLGLFFKVLEDQKIPVSRRAGRRFFNLLVLSGFLTFALAVTWSTPLPILFFINSAGVTIQFVALLYFMGIVREIWPELRRRIPTWVALLFQIAIGAFVLKILIQTAVVVPYIGKVGYTIRNFVIGFLHLILLGMITGFLLGLGAYVRKIQTENPFIRAGLRLFFIGFVASELLLFGQGVLFWAAMGFIPAYYELLFGVSALMPLGFAAILWGQWRR